MFGLQAGNLKMWWHRLGRSRRGGNRGSATVELAGTCCFCCGCVVGRGRVSDTAGNQSPALPCTFSKAVELSCESGGMEKRPQLELMDPSSDQRRKSPAGGRFVNLECVWQPELLRAFVLRQVPEGNHQPCLLPATQGACWKTASRGI